MASHTAEPTPVKDCSSACEVAGVAPVVSQLHVEQLVPVPGSYLLCALHVSGALVLEVGVAVVFGASVSATQPFVAW